MKGEGGHAYNAQRVASRFGTMCHVFYEVYYVVIPIHRHRLRAAPEDLNGEKREEAQLRAGSGTENGMTSCCTAAL
jgi:hypothetical protein